MSSKQYMLLILISSKTVHVIDINIK